MSFLSKDQRNEIFRTIASSRLGSDECEFYRHSVYGWPVVRHLSSGSEFGIRRDYTRRDSFLLEIRLGDDPNPTLTRVDGFNAIVEQLLCWAASVSEWINTVDPWDFSDNGSDIPGAQAPESANSPLTPDEQAAVSEQLKSIREAIKQTYNLTADQSAKLDEKFEEADKASQRMGRKDWGLLFGGAVFSLILADAITPDVAGHILLLIEHGVGHLFSGPAVGGVLSDGQG